MPQIGWLEILAIVIIAILVLGPKEFPIALKKIGSYFGKLKLPVKNDKDPVSGLSFTKLFDFSTKSSKSEIQWNISIPITIFILLILGVTLSKVGPRQGRLSVLLPAIFVYILYLSLLILARESYSENSYNAQNYIWYVHIIFLSFSLLTLFKTCLLYTSPSPRD